MAMSLYKPEKGLTYKFIDKQISRAFQIGSVGCYLHKYLGTKNPTEGTADQPIYDTVSPTNIQDLLFLENGDRKYDTEIYQIRGQYHVQNIDFNISQFGLFIDNDTLYMHVHINDFINYIGRKPLSGDVFELPNLKDDFALNDFDFSLPRYYVVEDVGRASEGFSATWYPHVYRLKLKKVTNNQQFADIMNVPADPNANFAGEYDPSVTYKPGEIARLNGVLYEVTSPLSTNLPPPSVDWSIYNDTLANTLSTKAKELQINDQILQQAENDAPMSGYETRQFYTVAVDSTGNAIINTADMYDMDASNMSWFASESNARPLRTGYTGYLVGDGFPMNGYDFGFGIQFPADPGKDDYFLRTDFLPSRLFRYDGNSWIKMEDAVRMDMTNNNTRQTLRTSFINNTNFTYNELVASDVVKLSVGTNVINTTIDYTVPLYVRLKLKTVKLEYVVADYPNLLTRYTDVNNVDKVRLRLPNLVNATAIATESLTSIITVDSTTGVTSGMMIAFIGNTFGSLDPNVLYFVNKVIDSTHFTLSRANGDLAPMLDGSGSMHIVDALIPYSGIWEIDFYNYREAEQQSLSKALRPRADL